VSISTEIDLLFPNMIPVIFSGLDAAFLVKEANMAKFKKKMSND